MATSLYGFMKEHSMPACLASLPVELQLGIIEHVVGLDVLHAAKQSLRHPEEDGAHFSFQSQLALAHRDIRTALQPLSLVNKHFNKLAEPLLWLGVPFARLEDDLFLSQIVPRHGHALRYLRFFNDSIGSSDAFRAVMQDCPRLESLRVWNSGEQWTAAANELAALPLKALALPLEINKHHALATVLSGLSSTLSSLWLHVPHKHSGYEGTFTEIAHSDILRRVALSGSWPSQALSILDSCTHVSHVERYGDLTLDEVEGFVEKHASSTEERTIRLSFSSYRRRQLKGSAEWSVLEAKARLAGWSIVMVGSE